MVYTDINLADRFFFRSSGRDYGVSDISLVAISFRSREFIFFSMELSEYYYSRSTGVGGQSMCPGLDEIKPSTKKQENTMVMAVMVMVVVVEGVVMVEGMGVMRGGGREGKLSLALDGNLRLQGYRAVVPLEGSLSLFRGRCVTNT